MPPATFYHFIRQITLAFSTNRGMLCLKSQIITHKNASCFRLLFPKVLRELPQLPRDLLLLFLACDERGDFASAADDPFPPREMKERGIIYTIQEEGEIMLDMFAETIKRKKANEAIFSSRTTFKNLFRLCDISYMTIGSLLSIVILRARLDCLTKPSDISRLTKSMPKFFHF